MSTDKTTLADVQPGGMVRLGDPAERARFEAWVKNHVSSLARAADGDYASNFTHALWSAWQAALSTHPSPGGQDALAALQQDYDKLLDTFNRQVEVAEKIAGRVLQQDDWIEELEEALAARQPVELIAHKVGDYRVTVAEDAITVSHGRDIVFAYSAGDPEPINARQPVGATDQQYNSGGIELTACQLHEALLMAGSPELDVPFEDRSLVRIFWTETGHSGRGLYCECVGAEEEGCILLDGSAPAIGQSAQAVDLGAMPDGWRLSKKTTCYQLSHGNEIIGNLVGPDAKANAAIIARVLDSQAVGND